ncbi:hypothetical protein Hypma_006099 [Hypsizygus marmoreus]|uniref:Uncharacterized protein n=1 Tax=Hypsizygus marmoreus TaxID=39966 RepID=A0A369JY75_HYPMA|nr:hypothetical protein Hypma_006099 [Hypsizygus marmoreus]
MDFTSSGWSTPRRMPPPIESNHTDFADIWARKTERLLLSESGSRTRLEARRLEDKVAKVAAKKCSVEEVSTLHKELEDWLMSDVKDDQTTSLYLSAALLRAILMNHLAHSEASRNAKAVESQLKSKIDDLEIMNGKLEAELRKQRSQYTQKAQDYQTVWTELNRLKASLGIAPDARQSATSPTPPSTSPVPPYSPTTQTPLSRFNSVHVRSASMSSRPSTPSTPMPSRSHTPAPLTRSQTPAPPLARPQTPSVRSYTPSLRSYTPAPPLRLSTPAPSLLRTQTPAPPPIPHKPRRLSTPSPPKMMRSTSEEKAEVHERWLPPMESEYASKTHKYTSRPPSRMASYGSSAAAAAARYRDTRSPSPAS